MAMKNPLPKNSKKKWLLRFMVYPAQRKGWYTAVCLDLAIVREGKDAFKLYQQINKLAMQYVDLVISDDLENKLLNQKLPNQYIKKFERLEQESTHHLKEKWERIVGAIIWRQRIAEHGRVMSVA